MSNYSNELRKLSEESGSRSVSFKKYPMELSDACTTMVNNVKRKERNRRQS